MYRDGSEWYIINAAGGDPQLLSSKADRFVLGPQWSADGRFILAGYQELPDEGPKLISLDVKTGKQRNLIVWKRPSGVQSFAISPSDGRIAFVAEVCKKQQSDLFFWKSYESCFYRPLVATKNGRNPKQVGTILTNLKHSPPALIWTEFLPPATLPEAAFAQTDITPEATQKDIAPEAIPENLVMLGDLVEQDGHSFVVVALADPAPPGSLYEEREGFRLVAVEVIVGNVSGETFSSSALNGKLLDSDGFTYEPESGIVQNNLDSITVQPGERVRGWIPFMIPIAFLIDGNGFVYRAKFSGRDEQLKPTDLATGEQALGWVFFEIPEDAIPARIKYQMSGYPIVELYANLDSGESPGAGFTTGHFSMVADIMSSIRLRSGQVSRRFLPRNPT